MNRNWGGKEEEEQVWSRRMRRNQKETWYKGPEVGCRSLCGGCTVTGGPQQEEGRQRGSDHKGLCSQSHHSHSPGY